jgi:hypothetical protein
VIRQFLPAGERDLGLGSNDRRNQSCDVQELLPMELAERFSNPDFLARIDRLLKNLEGL